MRLIASPSMRADRADCLIFAHALDLRPQRDRVGDDELLERRVVDALDGRPREHAVRAQAETERAPAVHERLRGVRQRAGRVDDVVDDDGVLALDVADDVHDLGDVGRRAPLVDDGERRAEPLRVGARALDAAGVGRDDDGVSLPSRACLSSSIITGIAYR